MTPGGPARWVVLSSGLALFALIVPIPPCAAGAPVRGLTEGLALARAYELVYDADFAAADAELTRACGPAPAQACDVIGTAALWWRIYFDPDDRSRDQAFLSRITRVIERGEQWVAREPERAEAWFYLGAAYGSRVQYHAQRNEFLAAARDGKRIKVSLEQALVLDPALHDANVGVGLYQYYADMAPAVLKLLRWLMNLPGGDKVRGLQRIFRTRDQGLLLRSEAAYQLHLIHLWYEHQPDRALALLDELHARYPHNPLFLLNIAQVHDVYRSDRPAALAAYRRLADGARTGQLREPELAETWGRLGTAAQLDALAETDRALDELRIVVAARPRAPYGAIAQAQLDMGRALDRLGLRTEARAAYAAAQTSAPPDDPRHVRSRAREGLSRTPDRTTSEAFRLSIEGWRAFERGDLAAASPLLDRAVLLRPDDGVHRYRRGRLAAARQDRPRAIADFERALQVRPSPPAPLVAASFLECGRLYEAQGDRTRAASLYGSASRVRGADPSTREAAELALARVKQ